MTFADDAGEYSIFAKNPLGESSAIAHLMDEGISIIEFSSLFTGPLPHNLSKHLFTDQYEAFMKQDVTYKAEVTTTVVPEPQLVLSQYEQDQRRMTTPMSFVSETVLFLQTCTCDMFSSPPFIFNVQHCLYFIILGIPNFSL